MGTSVCSTGGVAPARDPFLSHLIKPWSDFLSLPAQVENGPSEFALYIVHESGGKCLPVLPDHKNQSLCPFGKLTDHAPSLRAIVNALPGPNPGTLAAPFRIPPNPQGKPLSLTSLRWEGLGMHITGCEPELKPLDP